MNVQNPLPSPENSPLLQPAPSPSQLDTQPSRKRQRSHSMQSSASSSSLKRTVSESVQSSNTRSPRADRLSALTITDQANDADAYLAEQGAMDIEPLDLAPSTSVSVEASKTMSGQAKVDLIESLRCKPMHIGEEWYLVDITWWNTWKSACTGVATKEGPISEADIGPVDNSGLLDSSQNLRYTILEGRDYNILPGEAWNHLKAWYGPSETAICRRTIARGITKQVALELYPPRVRVLKLTKEKVDDELPNAYITTSSDATMQNFTARLVKVFLPGDQALQAPPHRIWKVRSPGEMLTHLSCSVAELRESQPALLEPPNETLENEDIHNEDAFVVEFQEAGKWIFEDSSTSATTSEPPPLWNSDESFFNKMGRSSTSTALTTYGSTTSSSSALGNGFKSIFSSTSLAKPIDPGTLGLSNMGNTCFMNSALQCLAHNKELTDYFLTGVYKSELNPDNPLGMHGAIAEAFGDLLGRLWANTAAMNYYAPREFKAQLQRFAPQFAGYQQHDSQELVAFLLDGLHEDLNRVLKKPYVEKPDWEGGGDLELLKLAQKSWEGYMMRNDSVIVDLFQGQYQSTLVCPECQKVSITFDPFMYLTLPLPIQKKWRHDIYYVPWNNEAPHMKIPVELGRDSSFRDVRVLLGRWMDVDPDNLLTLEVFNHRFFKNLNDACPCSDISGNDIVVCYELPCHSQQSRTYKPQPSDPVIVPVFLCMPSLPHTRGLYPPMRAPALFGYPTVVPIYPHQRADPNKIYDLLCERLERYSTNGRDFWKWELPSNLKAEVVQVNGASITNPIAEIHESGDIVHVEEVATMEEGDIADEKLLEEDLESTQVEDVEPVRVETKKGLFEIRVIRNSPNFGCGQFSSRFSEEDIDQIESDDAIYCEFEPNLKEYYFGDEGSRWEHATWERWEDFIHPEYEASVKASESASKRGITLMDCLNEFTKEEQLGEEDLWYCPRCKKHQQATKKFDLWKTPDILVVHLKRFSNSRTLRDKIDALVDFPIEGLELGDQCGERAVVQRLVDLGHGLEELNADGWDEPLVYDLFAVDEHIGGLGGGHYRAYAHNHLTEKWYHFDDSHVTTTRASNAVNANAYLLFYRRRTAKPLGGKTAKQVEEARLHPRLEDPPEVNGTAKIEPQLPTPPDEDSDPLPLLGPSMLNGYDVPHWTQTTAPMDSEDPPPFGDTTGTELIASNLNSDFEFPDLSGGPSPSSSVEAEADSEIQMLGDSEMWAQYPSTFQSTSPAGSSWSTNSGFRSPTQNSSTLDLSGSSDAVRPDSDDDP